MPIHHSRRSLKDCTSTNRTLYKYKSMFASTGIVAVMNECIDMKGMLFRPEWKYEVYPKVSGTNNSRNTHKHFKDYAPEPHLPIYSIKIVQSNPA